MTANSLTLDSNSPGRRPGDRQIDFDREEDKMRGFYDNDKLGSLDSHSESQKEITRAL